MSNSPLVAYTKLSPNKTTVRKNAIDTITIHCVVGQVTAERLGEIFANPAKQASSNYGVDKTGRVGLYVDEASRSWCSSTGNGKDTNDHRAVTIEVASDTTHPYAVTKEAYQATIDLCVDICKRNGKKSLVFLGSLDATKKAWAEGKTDVMYMTAHRWFANKSCPGDYLYSRFPEIAEKVTEALNPKPQSSIPTVTFPVQTVKLGCQGDYVLPVQILLKGLNYYTGSLDKSAGKKTHEAILKYQQERQLVKDGEFGPKCWKSFLEI